MSYFHPHVAIVGSRSFSDYDYMHTKMHEVEDGPEVQRAFGGALNYKVSFTMVVSGGAKGADKLAERFALEHDKSLIVHHADWDKYGRAAGYKRNKLIVADCDVLVAFWDGESRGTKHSIDLAVEQNKLVFILKDWKGNE